MSTLAPDALGRLAAAGRIERAARRTVVPLESPAITFVYEGVFRVFRNAAFVRDVTLALAGPGEPLAPGALFGERSAESGAEALTDGALVAISAESFAHEAAADPGLYGAVARALARRTLRVQQKVEAQSRGTVEARIAAALLEIAAQAGVPGAGGTIRLALPVSQADLASLAGTTRESASSAVAAFARQGLVRGGRLNGLVLLDPAALAELAAVDFQGS